MSFVVRQAGQGAAYDFGGARFVMKATGAETRGQLAVMEVLSPAGLGARAALAGQLVVLVGHSYGGAVITNAAISDPEVKALIYVDGFIPDQAETLGQLINSVPGSCLGGDPANVFNLMPYPGGPPRDVDTHIRPSLEDHPFLGSDRDR